MEQLAVWAEAGLPPTYESLEKHITLLTTVVFVLQANMLCGDAIGLAFVDAKHVLVKELGFPSEIVEKCLEQLQTRGRQLRRKNVLVAACGTP